MAEPIQNTPKKIIKIIQSGDYPPTQPPPQQNNSGLPSPYLPPPTTSSQSNSEPPLLSSSAPPTNPFYRYPPHQQHQQPAQVPPSSSSSAIPKGIKVIKPTPKTFPTITTPASPEDAKKAIKGFIGSDSATSSSLLPKKAAPDASVSYDSLLASKLFDGLGIKIIDQVLTLETYPGDNVKVVTSVKSQPSKGPFSSSTATTAEKTLDGSHDGKPPLSAAQHPTTTMEFADKSNNEVSTTKPRVVPQQARSQQLKSEANSASFTGFEKLLVFINVVIFCGILFSCVVLGKLLVTVHNKEVLECIAWVTELLQ